MTSLLGDNNTKRERGGKNDTIMVELFLLMFKAAVLLLLLFAALIWKLCLLTQVLVKLILKVTVSLGYNNTKQEQGVKY